MKKQHPFHGVWRWRSVVLMGVFTLVAFALIGRAFDLQVVNKGFLLDQGQARHVRVVDIPAHRGMILDRNGEPLAVSTPVDSVWANPREMARLPSHLRKLSRMLAIPLSNLRKIIRQHRDKEFVYLKRGMDPQDAERIMSLHVPGIYLQREYRRYYPAGEVTSHILGFTNVDDVGQEGLELAYNKWLQGQTGLERVIKDRLGRTIQVLDNIRAAHPGRNLVTSLDLRIQYLAYRTLKAAVQEQGAKSGSIIVLDTHTGEILAMANQPSFNPNNRDSFKGNLYRNRAVTDQFEPGSSFKPFVIAAALESGDYTPRSVVDTSPGYLRIAGYTIDDEHHDYGPITVTQVLEKSSNVGASKIALSLNPQLIWHTLSDFGFGRSTGSGFPGEASGDLRAWEDWSKAGQAAISYGYGVSVTTLQLADAYMTVANGGVHRPVSFTRLDPDEISAGERVVSPHIAHELRDMLETVVSPAGTGDLASIAGYRVAGKTGTARKAEDGGYSKDHYISVFAGMAPASDPRLVTVVVINQPSKGAYYGGLVSAPVFARVMSAALRLLDVPPDNLSSETTAYVIHLQKGHAS